MGLVLTGSFAIVIDRVAQNESDGLLINTAGQQRMLSQRVALMAREVEAAGSSAEAAKLTSRFARALEQMQSNHRAIRNWNRAADTNEDILWIYRRNGGLNERTSEFLAAGHGFLAGCAAAGDASTNVYPPIAVSAEALVQIARSGYLEELNAAVMAYQADFESEVRSFRSIEATALAVGLLLLALEARFIFAPMVRALRGSMGSLAAANRRIQSSSFRMAHEIRGPLASSLGMVALASDSNEEGDAEGVQFALSRANEGLHSIDEMLTRLRNELHEIDSGELGHDYEGPESLIAAQRHQVEHA